MTGGVAAIIPARLGSTRLPAKPLLRETGKYLIQHVHERVRAARGLDRVIVATDDEGIADAVRSFGGEVRLTSPDHPSGTDRVAEVARSLDVAAVLNVQGDEPEIDPGELERLAAAIQEPGAEMATFAVPFREPERWREPDAVKVVVAGDGRALYFSRSPLPWTRDPDAAAAEGLLLKHLGVYAYTVETLLRFSQLPETPLERLERLEQLRALHHGIRIQVLETDHDSSGIDTEADYRRFVDRTRQNSEISP